MSSERRYNDIENKIIEAANGSDYPFNEASWKKMEALLDEQKDRRRPFFWLFTAMVLGVLFLGAAYVYKINTQKNNLPITNNQKRDRGNDQLSQNTINTHTNQAENELTVSKNKQPVSPNEPAASPDSQPAAAIKNNIDKDSADEMVKRNTSNDLTAGTNENGDAGTGKVNNHATKNKTTPVLVTANKLPVNGKKNTHTKHAVEKKYTSDGDYNSGKKISYKTKHKVAIQVTAPGMDTDEAIATNTEDTNSNAISITDATSKTTAADTAVTAVTGTKKNKEDSVVTQPTTTKKTDPEKDQKRSVLPGLYVVGGLGAEISSAKLLSFKNGRIAPRYGIAAGYQLNKRWSVQAGFYAGAKKYMAGPNDYKVKAGSYLSTVNIIDIDANCMVYEIPVSFQYNLVTKPSTNYYVAVGLSSYLMKKETYNYTFETYGTVYSYPHTYTKNSHLLATANFSVGIEKKIGRKFYLQAAPVVNIPLKGVGDGEIKLFTTSLNIGLKYFPFKK